MTSVSVSALDESQELALQHTCRTRVSTWLSDLCAQVQFMRKALLNSKWEERGDVSKALAAVSRAIESRPKDNIVCDSIQLESLIAEVELVKLEWRDRALHRMAYAALEGGAVSGNIGHMLTETIVLSLLDSALAQAQEWGIVNGFTSQMYKMVSHVRVLRASLKAKAWDDVDSVVHAFAREPNDLLLQHQATKEQERKHEKESDQDEWKLLPGGFEFVRAHLELINREIIGAFRKALASGMAMGEIGSLVCSTIQIEALDEALAFAKEHGCKSPEAEKLLVTAEKVKIVRLGLAIGGHEGLSQIRRGPILVGISNGSFHEMSCRELKLACDEHDNFFMIHAMQNALSSGYASGTVGSFDNSTIVVDTLKAAIDLADSWVPKTALAQHLRKKSKLFYGLRQAQLDDNWDKVHKWLEDIKDAASQQGMKDILLVNEHDFAEKEYRDRQSRKLL